MATMVLEGSRLQKRVNGSMKPKNGCRWRVTRNLDVTRVRAIYKKADYREQRKAKMQD